MSINWFVKLGLWCQKHVAKFLFKIKIIMKENQYIVIFGIQGRPMAEEYAVAIEVIQRPSAETNMLAIYEATVNAAKLNFNKDLKLTDVAIHCLTRIN